MTYTFKKQFVVAILLHALCNFTAAKVHTNLFFFLFQTILIFTSFIQTFKIKKYMDVEWLYLKFNVIKLPQIQKIIFNRK